MNSSTFKAMVVRESSQGIFTRNVEQKSFNDLPENNVLIKVNYSSLNYKDVLSAMGNKGVTRVYPHTPGIDAAGIVEQSNTTNFKKGDPVIVTGYDLGMNTSGGFAEYVRVPENWVVPLPKNLTLKESMMYGTAGFTAGLACHKILEHGVTRDKGPVLVTGATGGVGSIAVAILSKIGYEVTALNGHHDRSDYLKSIGASHVLALDEVTGTREKALLAQKWSAVVDAVGGSVLEFAIKSVVSHGIVTTCGNVGSAEFTSSVYPFIIRGITLSGIDSATTPMPLRRTIWDKLAGPWKNDILCAIISELPDLESLDLQIEQIVNHTRTGRAIVNVS